MQLTSISSLIYKKPSNWILSTRVSLNVWVVIKEDEIKLPLGTYFVYNLVIWDDYNNKELCNYAEARRFLRVKDYYEEAIKIAREYYVPENQKLQA
jgi:hypothetical protein